MSDQEHVAKTLETNNAGLAFYEKAFAERDLQYVPSVANFILVKVGDGDAVFPSEVGKGSDCSCHARLQNTKLGADLYWDRG